VFVSVLVRRLKPGKTYDDFVDAWYPDKRGSDFPAAAPSSPATSTTTGRS
jgi:hypothetical protein